MRNSKLKLICPAGTPAALRTAVDAGADSVYLGFRDETNARNFPGLNFNREELAQGIDYAHDHDCAVYVAINTYPRAGANGPWLKAIDDAAKLMADAVIVADIGLLDYAFRQHPQLRRHLSVQASASNKESILFYYRQFKISRVVLPRVLTIPEIAKLNSCIPVETEVFSYGSLCIMAEGRCSLSSYVTGRSPNLNGVCSPASHVRYDERGEKLISKLGDFTINVFDKGESAGYPTPCKARLCVASRELSDYVFEKPTSLNTLDVLKELSDTGITALKIEGRQRGRAYVEKVVKTFRKAIDELDDESEGRDSSSLDSVSEGQSGITGSYKKEWQ